MRKGCHDNITISMLIARAVLKENKRKSADNNKKNTSHLGGVIGVFIGLLDNTQAVLLLL